MDRYPYEFRCTRCPAEVAVLTYDPPTGEASCGPASDHAWQRQVDPRRVAVHESGHAIAAAVLLGVESVKAMRLERPTESNTDFLGRPSSPEVLLATMAGPATGAWTGNPRDGLDGDLRTFVRGAFTWLAQSLQACPDIDVDAVSAEALSRASAAMRRAFADAAHDFVEQWEDPIDRLALVLLAKRHLEGSELTFAISEALGDRAGERFVSPVLGAEFPSDVWRRTAE